MKTAITSLKVLLLMTVLTGVIYPVFVTVIAQVIFPDKANGSLIEIDGKITGSQLLGQAFDSTRYFWSRPSGTAYNSLPSGGSNLGPTSQKLKKQVEERKRKFIELNGLKKNTEIPSEMIFASGSGLDPHITPEAALLQVDRITHTRSFTDHQKEHLIRLIREKTETPRFYFLGERRINVLMLNLELDKIK